MEMGSVVEEGAPAQLAANPDSHYAHLLAASHMQVAGGASGAREDSPR